MTFEDMQEIADFLNERGVELGRYGQLVVNGSEYLLVDDPEADELGWDVTTWEKWDK